MREEIRHAMDSVSAAIEKASYGDSVESDLLEAHATLDSLASALDAEPRLCRLSAGHPGMHYEYGPAVHGADECGQPVPGYARIWEAPDA